MRFLWLIRTWQRWWFSIVMMAAYVTLFVSWKLAPSRATFIVSAVVMTGGLTAAMVAAYRKGYFAGRVDVVLHGLVIVDVFLEGIAFEVALLFVPGKADLPRLVDRYHNSNSFLMCALLFALLLGVGHYLGLRRRKSALTK